MHRLKITSPQRNQVAAHIRAHPGQYQIRVSHRDARARAEGNRAMQLSDPAVQEFGRGLHALVRDDSGPDVDRSKRLKKIESRASPRLWRTQSRIIRLARR